MTVLMENGEIMRRHFKKAHPGGGSSPPVPWDGVKQLKLKWHPWTSGGNLDIFKQLALVLRSEGNGKPLHYYPMTTSKHHSLCWPPTSLVEKAPEEEDSIVISCKMS